MIYTLTFNPSLDYVAYADDLAEGAIHKISDYELFPGGKGINVSQVLKELNVASVAWGFTAGVTGESLKKLLDEKGINYDFIDLPDGLTRINVKLRRHINKIENELAQIQDCIGNDTTETDFNGTGLIITNEVISELKEKITKLSKDDMLVISGSVPSSVLPETFAEVLDEVDKTGAKLVVDLTGDYLEVALKHKPFLVKPNEEELKDFLSNIHKNLTNIRDNGLDMMAEQLKNMGAVNVLVSLGEKGAFLLTEEGERFDMKPPVGEVVNTVGAGDSMVAGFIAGMCKFKSGISLECDSATTQNYEQVLKLAVCSGSASAFSKGLAKKETIERLLNGF